MRLLGVDFETTGLDFQADRIVEVGAVLWDCESRLPMQLLSALVLDTDGPGISAEVEAVHGISSAMLTEHGESPDIVFDKLFSMMQQAEFAVAHFGTTFDKPMLEAQAARMSTEEAEGVAQMRWIDTAVDVPFPEKIKTRNLRHLAAEHGFLNPFAHRAIFDVLTMLRVLSEYDLDGVIESARQPSVTLKAIVSFDDKDKAKERGYKWNAEAKEWTRQIKAHKAEQERAECGFKTILLNPSNCST